jgi:hypothetical protein
MSVFWLRAIYIMFFLYINGDKLFLFFFSLCMALKKVNFICDHPDIKAISFVGSDQAVNQHQSWKISYKQLIAFFFYI